VTTRPTQQATDSASPCGRGLWLCAAAAAALGAMALHATAGGLSPEDRLRRIEERGRGHLGVGDYDSALDAAAQMLRIAPGHAQALRLEQDTHRASLEQSVPIVSDGRKPDASLAAEISREREPLMTHDAPPDPVAVDTVRLALRRPISVAFQDTPLRDAARQLSEAIGMPVALDADADGDATVTCSDTPVPAASAVRWVARLSGHRYRIEDGAIVFGKAAGADVDVVEHVYDINSLLGARTKERDQDGKVVVNHRGGEGWVSFIKDTIAPDTWTETAQTLQEAPQYSIQYRNGRIVVVHTPEVQQQIADLLDKFRQARNLMVHITGRFILVSKVYLDGLFVDYAFDTLDDRPDNRSRADGTLLNTPDVSSLTRFSLIGGGGMSLVYTYIGDEVLQVMLNGLLQEQNGTTLLAPRLTCFNTQRAIFQEVINYNYVRRVSSDDEPEIGNIPAGIVFDVQPFVSSDRKTITLILQPSLRSVQSLEELSFHDAAAGADAGGGNGLGLFVDERLIQIATTVLRSVGTTVTVPDGGTILVAGFDEAEDHQGVTTLPFIEGIPIVRQMLRGWARNDGRRSFIVLVSAQIVPDIFEE